MGRRVEGLRQWTKVVRDFSVAAVNAAKLPFVAGEVERPRVNTEVGDALFGQGEDRNLFLVRDQRLVGEVVTRANAIAAVKCQSRALLKAEELDEVQASSFADRVEASALVSHVRAGLASERVVALRAVGVDRDTAARLDGTEEADGVGRRHPFQDYVGAVDNEAVHDVGRNFLDWLDFMLRDPVQETDQLPGTVEAPLSVDPCASEEVGAHFRSGGRGLKPVAAGFADGVARVDFRLGGLLRHWPDDFEARQSAARRVVLHEGELDQAYFFAAGHHVPIAHRRWGLCARRRTAQEEARRRERGELERGEITSIHMSGFFVLYLKMCDEASR